MSYCRFAWGGSDVYVYEGHEGLVCCGCKLKDWFVCKTPEEMICHLAEHKKAGHFVPPHAIEGLWYDVEGPNEAVTPEPETMTEARHMLRTAEAKVDQKEWEEDVVKMLRRLNLKDMSDQAQELNMGY